ncbi:MAG TPA: 8-amino-7-oxononanoate synthase [Burkholderiaceae bacterium]|nr:8-amino-7-oxononanoate synthase [Burkholderiaceae bacterium]
MDSDPRDTLSSWLDDLPSALDELARNHLTRLRRTVRPAGEAWLWVDGRRLLAFCSNDYLGLSQHPALAASARAAIDRYGIGSGASPLVSGHSEANAALEDELAAFVGLPRALYFYAGFATNAGVIPALVGPGDAIFSDRLNHASLIDGARLSKAAIHRYAHADLGALEAALVAAPNVRRKLVLTDAVFSMDGDTVDLAASIALCERHDALLLVDDAHGFGVRGPQGRGSLAATGCSGAAASRHVLYMATLSKSAGVAGAFVAGSSTLVEWLLQKTRSYIFATAAPALLAESVRAALRVMQAEPSHLARLQGHIERLRTELPRAIAGTPWRLLPSDTAVQALVIGANETALAVMRALADEGLWVPAIRPPTVPAGTARLRIALSAAHTQDDITTLLTALARIAQAQAA